MNLLRVDNAGSDPEGVSDAVTKWSAAVSAVLALLGTLGAGAITVAGSAERMFREQFLASVSAVLIFIFGFVLVGLAIVLTPGAAKISRARRTRFLGASITVFGVALVLGTLAAGNSAASQEEPSIQAHLVTGDGFLIEGSVNASGLRSDQRLAIHALGYSNGAEDGVSLFRAVAGPTRDGSLSVPLAIPLPSHGIETIVISAWRNDAEPPDCNQAERNNQPRVACALIRMLPAGYGAPRLQISRGDSGGDVSGSVAALVPPDSLLHLVVLEEGNTEPAYEQLVAPDDTGVVDQELPTVSVDPTVRVCVVAGVDARFHAHCPPDPRTDMSTDSRTPTTWVVLPPAPLETPAASSAP